MLKPVVAVGWLLAVAVDARATVHIQVEPVERGPFTPGQKVSVEIRLVQTGDESKDQLLRLVQFDFSARSNDELEINLPLTHPEAGIYGWDFSTTPHCMADEADCGLGHFVDDQWVGPGILGPDMLAIAYYFVEPNNLTSNSDAQLLLPASGPLTIARLEVTLSRRTGTYTLDLVNAATADLNRGAVVYYGFGVEPDDPVRILRTHEPAPRNLTGGTYSFTVRLPDEDANLVASVPACNSGGTRLGSWWRSANNTARLTFDREIIAPELGDVRVVQLLPEGAYGEDVSGEFSFSLENDEDGLPRTLRVRQAGLVDPENTADGRLENRKWYAILNEGDWAGVTPFKIDLVVQVGDSNGDGRVNSNKSRLGAFPIRIPKPTDHDCSP